LDSDLEETSNDNASMQSNDDDKKELEDTACIVPPQAGAHNISIRAQSSALQLVIKAAVLEITGDALFTTAYPCAITFSGYLRDILRTAAKNLNLPVISHRFAEDRKYAEIISRVVCLPMLLPGPPQCLVLYLATAGRPPFKPP
jgi:hypothetical protein